MRSGASRSRLISAAATPAAVLSARDAREFTRTEALARALARGAGALIWMSVNVPGPDKRPPGIDRLFASAVEAVTARVPGAALEAEGLDVLGPYRAFSVRVRAGASAVNLKRAMADLERALPAGRLLDLDVYGRRGEPLDRPSLGLPPRACLVCDAPARECIRTGRHTREELAAAVASLLTPLAAGPRVAPPAPGRLFAAETLADTLVRGATLELELTPKPGLVDRLDNGSHPDLTFERMVQSIELLPAYYAELLHLRHEGAPLDACVGAGRRAEQRMFERVGTNTHRGYIFLSGLLLLAAIDAEMAPGAMRAAHRRRRPAGVRTRIRALAGEFFGRDTGSVVPRGPRQLRGGVRDEALRGLPSVFEAGWPSYCRARTREGPGDRAGFALLATLMQRVDDTTARRRCGEAGLARLRRDGAILGDLVARDADPTPTLASWNGEYRRMGLTMGGVADCMALVFAIDLADQTPAPARAI